MCRLSCGVVGMVSVNSTNVWFFMGVCCVMGDSVNSDWDVLCRSTRLQCAAAN